MELNTEEREKDRELYCQDCRDKMGMPVGVVVTVVSMVSGWS